MRGRVGCVRGLKGLVRFGCEEVDMGWIARYGLDKHDVGNCVMAFRLR